MKSKSKSLAIISLVVMGLGFIITILIPKTLVAGILHGGFEAGLVGGLADWFAVTALFRHPMGLPIPHTALLPKNRDKLTKGIISMIENDWLSKASVTNKIQKLLVTEKLIQLVENELHSKNTKDGISSFLVEIINHINEGQLANLIAKELKAYLINVDTNKVLNTFLDQFLQQHYEEKGFDFILLKMKEWVEEGENQNKIGTATLKGLSQLKLDGLMQFALHSLINMVSDEKMGQIISNMLKNVIENLQTKDNTLRRDFISLIRDELNDLGTNQNLIQTLEDLKVNWINELDLASEISLYLIKLKAKWIDLLQESSNVDQYIVPFLSKWIDRLKLNSNLLGKFDLWLQNKVVNFINKNHHKIGIMVKENLDKLDDPTLTLTIEDRVGKDLQWIRVNGAICGFVIGIVLSFF
jgi:uncharacterized membrane-anchored protein YjiN (DUF445 family)